MKREMRDKIHSSASKTSINLANMGIKDDEIQAVMLEIKQFLPDISVIDLDSNNLSDNGAQTLANCLRDFNGLTILSLQFNNIDKDGVISLLTSKPTNLGIFFHGNMIHNVSEMARIEQEIQNPPPLTK